MQFLDLSANPRIAVLMQMVSAMSTSRDSTLLFESFLVAIQRAYGKRCLIALSTRGLGPGQYRVIRWRCEDDTERVQASPNIWDDSRSQRVHDRGLLSAVVGQPMPSVSADLHVADDPALGDGLSPYRSMLAVPIFIEGQADHWMVLLDRKPSAFSDSDVENGIVRANLIGSAMHNLETSAALKRAAEQIDAEVQRIAAIQRALLPAKVPDIPGLSIATSYQTYDTVGGDMYDFCRVDVCDGEGVAGAAAGAPAGPGGERWALLIADASGHGPAAAVMMAMLHAILHSFPRVPKGPGELLEYINRHLCDKRIEQSFVTAFLGFYDPRAGTLTYARAGHNPPLLKCPPASASPVQRLEAVGDLPLGILDSAHYDDAVVKLHPGQTLVLYTDGVTDAVGPGAEPMGVEGIQRAIANCSGEPACVIDSINRALKEHAAGVRPNDDQTIVAVQVG